MNQYILLPLPVETIPEALAPGHHASNRTCGQADSKNGDHGHSFGITGVFSLRASGPASENPPGRHVLAYPAPEVIMQFAPAVQSPPPPHAEHRPLLHSFDSGAECSLAHWLEVSYLVEHEEDVLEGYLVEDSCFVVNR